MFIVIKTWNVFLCSAMCKERYEDFKNRGIKVEFIKIDKTEK